MGPEVVLKGFPGTKNPGDAVVAWENKQLFRQLERKTAIGRQKSGERMNVDDCNGRTYAGNEGESTEQAYYGGQQCPPKSTNTQKTSQQHSLTNSVKVELCSDDESPCVEPENTEEVKDDQLSDPMDEGGAEYVLSRRDKCEVCGMICIGPNVLMVHKRSHTEDKSADVETKTVLQPSNDKIQFAERLSISMTKRKRSTPQKFLGEKHMHLNLPDAPYELSSGSEKEGELLSAHSGPDTFLSSTKSKDENHEPSTQSQLFPTYLSVIGRDAGESQDDQPTPLSLTTSPNGCPDSTDTESTAEEQSTRATGPTSTSNNHHLHYHNVPLSRSLPTSSPSQAKDTDTMWIKASPMPPVSVKKSARSLLSSRETMQVLGRDGRPVRSFHCRYCRILFLDHVMFTIHMGCHGFRQPFECNICGHRSHDRYEFSSHISRGEHQVG
uniref:C2H2-type domain-containing protein n=1 Tax=Knipowitschia caucasica TaxID=637954 RepID=A0AAV2LYU4_KNICA